VLLGFPPLGTARFSRRQATTSITGYRLFVKARFRPKSPPESIAYCVPENALALGYLESVLASLKAVGATLVVALAPT